jgi:uncharacterized protein YbjQ (UPF0145 family)
MALLAAVLLAGCDPAANVQVQAPRGGSPLDGARGSEGVSMSSGGVSSGSEHASSSSDSTGTGGQVLAHAEPPRATPAQAARVKVIFSGTPMVEATEVLGVVDVHEPASSDEQGLELMKERAAAMRADAVIGVEFHRDDKSFTDLSGLAVRYNDLLRGREYDTIDVIKVHEGEGKDGDAMGELQRRAGALHADLVIGIAWHDNDAEKDGTYLSGTAIRYRTQ